jgi:hypothetical protein
MKTLNSVCAAMALVASLTASISGQVETVTNGFLSVNDGDRIQDSKLASWISGIDSSANRLLILTECYGGEVALQFTGTNTAVTSATSLTSQTAYAGGYDTGAANALVPATGGNALGVHDLASLIKNPKESPTTGGGLALSSFPLDPVGTNNIESRHIIVYAGRPTNDDTTNRDTIVKNFSKESNTTVTTVGGAGSADGWNQPGTAAGLKDAIDSAKTAINNATNPSREQFILFVGDHGGERETQRVLVSLPPESGAPITAVDPTNPSPTQNGLLTFQSNPSSAAYMNPAMLGPGTTPGFSCFIDLSSTGNGRPVVTSSLSFIIEPSLWQMEVTPQTGPNAGHSIFLSNPILLANDYNGDGIIGDAPGEGVTLEFPVDPSVMTSSFFDTYAEIQVFNGTSNTWQVTDASQDTGDIAQAPEPAGIAWASLILLALRRSRGTGQMFFTR